MGPVFFHPLFFFFPSPPRLKHLGHQEEGSSFHLQFSSGRALSILQTALPSARPSAAAAAPPGGKPRRSEAERGGERRRVAARWAPALRRQSRSSELSWRKVSGHSPPHQICLAPRRKRKSPSFVYPLFLTRSSLFHFRCSSRRGAPELFQGEDPWIWVVISSLFLGGISLSLSLLASFSLLILSV